VKGTKRKKIQLALRIHVDVAARHERLLLHADARRQSIVGLAGSAAACSSCPRSGTGSSRSHSARPCSRRRRPSLRRAAVGPPSARNDGRLRRCANHGLGLREVHVVLPRRLVLQHDLTWICTCAHRIVLAAYDASKTTGCTVARTHDSLSCSL